MHIFLHLYILYVFLILDDSATNSGNDSMNANEKYEYQWFLYLKGKF